MSFIGQRADIQIISYLGEENYGHSPTYDLIFSQILFFFRNIFGFISEIVDFLQKVSYSTCILIWKKGLQVIWFYFGMKTDLHFWGHFQSCGFSRNSHSSEKS